MISTLNFLILYKELKSEKWLRQEVFLKYPTPSFDCFVSDKVLVDTFDLYDLHLKEVCAFFFYLNFNGGRRLMSL